MPVYITIALGITLLIGVGWFVKSYLSGDTVFNNNAIQQYPYALHDSRDISEMNHYEQNSISIANDNDDELEDKEEKDELSESLEEDEEMESYHNAEIENERYTSNNDQSTNNVDHSVQSSSDNGERGVREDVYGR
ncbi:hypothetical protein [Gracilibacillus massiliensis]|uniref:hypothetical protein n=1 Tax=Gracilibacillus massiliensis TaxID=1564956 RepID=UPI00071CD06B|nr:hypothetical protein [Gracilibacillus massiliensis]